MNRKINTTEIREYIKSHPELGVLSRRNIADSLNESGLWPEIHFNEKWFKNHSTVWTKEDKWNLNGGPCRTTLYRQKQRHPEELDITLSEAQMKAKLADEKINEAMKRLGLL